MGKGSENAKDGSQTETANRSSSDGTKLSPDSTLFTWKEVEAHGNKKDCWIVVNECVYELAKFKKRHPGSGKILDHFAGQDATVSGLLLVFTHFRGISLREFHDFTQRNCLKK